jgi:hypothetical protein
MAARRAFGVVVIAVAVAVALKGREPFLLLAAGGGGQQLEVFRLDAAVAVGVLDSGEQVGEPSALFDVEFGDTERERDVGEPAPLFEQSREGPYSSSSSIGRARYSRSGKLPSRPRRRLSR